MPVQLHLQATPTATGAIVVWQPITGGSRYTVHRLKRLDDRSKCCEKHVPNVTGFRYVDEPLPGTGRYLYRVVVHLRHDGRDARGSQSAGRHCDAGAAGWCSVSGRVELRSADQSNAGRLVGLLSAQPDHADRRNGRCHRRGHWLATAGQHSGPATDRPIGIVANQNNPNTTSLPNTTVVLTREIIETALATSAVGVVNPIPSILIPVVKPGIMVINFEDKAFTSNNTPFDGLFDRKAFYSMVLQVERLP